MSCRLHWETGFSFSSRRLFGASACCWVGTEFGYRRIKAFEVRCASAVILSFCGFVCLSILLPLLKRSSPST